MDPIDEDEDYVNVEKFVSPLETKNRIESYNVTADSNAMLSFSNERPEHSKKYQMKLMATTLRPSREPVRMDQH